MLLEYLVLRSKQLHEITNSSKLYKVYLKGIYSIWADGVSILKQLSNDIYVRSGIPRPQYMRLTKLFHRIKNYQELQHEYKRFEGAIQSDMVPGDQAQYLTLEGRPEIIGHPATSEFEQRIEQQNRKRPWPAIPKMLIKSKKSPYHRFKKIAASGIFDDSFRCLLEAYRKNPQLIDDFEKYPRTLSMLLFHIMQTRTWIEIKNCNAFVSQLPDIMKRKMPAATYRFIYKDVIDCAVNDYKRFLLKRYLKGIPKPKNLAQWHMLTHYIERVADKIDDQYNESHPIHEPYGRPQRASHFTSYLNKDNFIELYNSTNNEILKKFARDTIGEDCNRKLRWRSHHNFYSLLSKIGDGHNIYAQNKDQTLVKFVNLETQKTLLRQYKASIFNHKQLDRYGKILNEEKHKALFLIPMPTISWLPEELEQYRIKTKGDMVQAGQECHHCIGTYRDTMNSLFFRQGDICAEVKIEMYRTDVYQISQNFTNCSNDSTAVNPAVEPTMISAFRWIVNQCYDKYDRINDESKAFENWLNQQFKNIAVPIGGKIGE